MTSTPNLVESLNSEISHGLPMVNLMAMPKSEREAPRGIEQS